jgi:PAB-dependent poly(A)-specific ribonuclease subunit 3
MSKRPHNPLDGRRIIQQESNNVSSNLGSYDPYNTTTTGTIQAGLTNQPQQINPYAQDESVGTSGYYQGQETYSQPVRSFFAWKQQSTNHLKLNYHLYAPLGPHRENLLAYQRTVHDFFISDGIREELQRKSEASHQILPSKQISPRLWTPKLTRPRLDTSSTN